MVIYAKRCSWVLVGSEMDAVSERLSVNQLSITVCLPTHDARIYHASQ